MTHKELYSICHDEAVAYANLEQWSKRTGEEKSFLIQGYLDAMMEMRKSEITEMKKEYPKTYKECCEVLDIQGDWHLTFESNNSTSCALCFKNEFDYVCRLEAFRKLLICRNAYWKIAGEEMGSGKPWEPDWTDLDQLKYCIWVDVGEFITMTNVRGQHILAFPTEEMRDAFKENFKELIEQCKELL